MILDPVIRPWTGDARDPIRLEYHGSPRNYAFAEHSHAGHWEITYVRHGVLRHRIAGQDLLQQPGTLTMLRDCDRHAIAGEAVELVNLGFSTGFVEALERMPRRDRDVLAWARSDPGPLWCRLPVVERGSFEADLDRLGAALASPEEGLLLARILGQALLSCHRAASARGRGAQAPGWLAAVQALLLDHTQPLPDLRGLCRMTGVSREHLARSCRKHLGLSPSGFLNRCRCERAAVLLASDPERPVADIAAAVGFASAVYCARCFHAAFGTSPQEWRRQRRNYVLTEARQAALYRERHPAG